MSFGLTASSYVETLLSGDSAYANAVLAESPLMYLPFNETLGTVAVDASGNGHDGYYYGSAILGNYTVTSGSTGRSVRVDYGNSGGVVVPHSSWMDTAELTVLMPFYDNYNSGLRILAARYPNDDTLSLDSWFIDVGAGGTLWFWYRTSAGTNVFIDSGVAPSAYQRFFVAAYVNASEAGIRVYGEDGTLLGSGTGAGGAVNVTSADLTLFSAQAGYPFGGYIDDFVLFDRSLTTAKIDSLAALALAPHQPWIAKTTGSAGRNGTNSHTITFSPASSGSLLVAVLGGPVTHTMVTSGWTKQLSALMDTEIAVFTKTASSGESSLEVTHNGSNYPIEYAIYEFAVGSTYHSGVYKVYDGNPSFPTLSGLPGTKTSLFMGQCGDFGYAINTNWQFFWETQVSSYTTTDVTDGTALNIGYFAHTDFPDTTADITSPGGQYDSLNYNTAVMFAIQHT